MGESPNLDKKEFLLEEYKALRQDIEIHVSEARSLERYTIVTVGAIWGWLSANRIQHPVAWLIPLILTLGVGLRGFAMRFHFNRLSKYISDIESAYGVKG